MGEEYKDIETELLPAIWDAYRYHDEGPLDGSEPTGEIPYGNVMHKHAWNAIFSLLKEIKKLRQAANE